MENEFAMFVNLIKKIDDKTKPFKEKLDLLIKVLCDKSIDGDIKIEVVKEFKEFEEGIISQLPGDVERNRKNISETMSAYESLVLSIIANKSIEIKSYEKDSKGELTKEFSDKKLIEFLLRKNILSKQYKISLLRNKIDELDVENCLKCINEIYGRNIEMWELKNLLTFSADDKIRKYIRKQKIYINNTSELSEEDLEKMPNTEIVVVGSKEGIAEEAYFKDEYIKVKKAMDELMLGIPKVEKGNVESEIKVFLEVVERLARHITYDYLAVQDYMKDDFKLQEECRNLYGGLLNGKAVCAGYSRILMDALSRVGIECKCISGMGENNIGHAWNQVKIGEKWFNVDLTNSRDQIVEQRKAGLDILKTDDEFKPNFKFEISDGEKEICNTNAINYIVNNINSRKNKAEMEKRTTEKGNTQKQRNKDYGEIE